VVVDPLVVVASRAFDLEESGAGSGIALENGIHREVVELPHPRALDRRAVLSRLLMDGLHLPFACGAVSGGQVLMGSREARMALEERNENLDRPRPILPQDGETGFP
jgi:hypothetical protein